MMQHGLVLSNAPRYSAHLEAMLDEAGYVVSQAPGGFANPDAEVDVVILGPDSIGQMPTRAVCADLRRQERRPLILAAVDQGGIQALDADCADIDDFLVLPILPDELAARIAMRRPASARSDNIARGTPAWLALDRTAWRVTVGGRVLSLRRREFELLDYLVARAGRTMSREALLHRVWGPEYQGGRRTVDVHVQRLRSKLGSNASCLRTVHRVGYRFDPQEHQGAPPRESLAG